jgi:hypothetical protein
VPRSLEKYSSNHAKNISLSCADILVQSIVGSWEAESPILGGRVPRTMGGGPVAEGAGAVLGVGRVGRTGVGAADNPRGGSGGVDVGPRGGKGGVDAGPRGGKGGEDTGPRAGKGGEDTGPRDGKGGEDTGPRAGKGGAGGAVDPLDLLEAIEDGPIEPVRLGGGGNGASSAGLVF